MLGSLTVTPNIPEPLNMMCCLAGGTRPPAHKKPQSGEGGGCTETRGQAWGSRPWRAVSRERRCLHAEAASWAASGVSRSLPGRRGGEGVFQVAAATHAKAENGES